MYKSFLLSALVSLYFTGCSLQEQSIQNESHREKGSDLQVLMRDINTIVGNNQQSELERDDERRRYALNLVDSLKKFSSKVQDKNLQFKTKYVNEENSTFFYKQIKSLDRKVQEIESVANNYELERLDQKIVELQSICTSCHKVLGVKHVQNLF